STRCWAWRFFFDIDFLGRSKSNGKRSTKVRSRVQETTGSANRSRRVDEDAGRAHASTVTVFDRPVAEAVSGTEAGGPAIDAGTATGNREREAEGEGWRAGHAKRSVKKTAGLRTAVEKRRYVRDHRQKLGSVSKGLEVTGLASSTFYYQPKTDVSDRQRRDAELRDQIEAIQAEFAGYGYRRVQHELERHGQKINAKRIRRVMSENGLRPILWRSFVRTTDSNHSHRIYPNLLKN